MSKFKILLHGSVGILCCLFTLLFALRLTFTQSYIWASVCFISLVIQIIWFIKDYISSKASSIGNNCARLILLIWLGYQGYTIYNRDIHQDKYGFVFNKTRQKLGVPIIPPGWKIDFRGRTSAHWIGKEGAIGHEKKTIDFDSLLRVESENDNYNLKPLKGIPRDIRISFVYAPRKDQEARCYYYDIGDSTKRVTRQQADSLFTAEKIKRDY